MHLNSEKFENSRAPAGEPEPIAASIIGERLSLVAFSQLAGRLAGYPFVKVVVDRPTGTVHFINNARYAFHADYIAETLMGITAARLESQLDEFNASVYLNPDRRFYLGILALHKQGEHSIAAGDPRFFSIETVEIDNMSPEMVAYFYRTVRDHLDPSIPLFFKPANHSQETFVSGIPATELPRVFSHQIFSSSRFIALNSGVAQGRLRAFRDEKEYRLALPTLEWHDIVVMHRVPDDIPRISGIINAHHTTPLSHTNVLASGWQIPNAIQIGIFDRIEKDRLNGQWVRYTVESNATEVLLEKIVRPEEMSHAPAWTVQHVQLEAPETVNTPIVDLASLRMADRYKYGTKAANLGELQYVLANGSERLLGFYRVRRPPRLNLLPYLAKFLEIPESSDIARAAWTFLRSDVSIPRGIAIPFSVQQEFLQSSPGIQQAIGKLKMALELNVREVEPLCLNLQAMIRGTRMPDRVRNYIDSQIACHLSGVSSFVVRSSSNAEDLENFSAAGIYESINHVTTAENIFQSIKEVWSSLLSPRSVRLRHQVRISLDDCYMGVIVQEEVQAKMGGVMVTTNPMNRQDFRNVFVNVSSKSVNSIVQGSEMPIQFLYNTVEGGGRTLSLGDAKEDLSDSQKVSLQRLAIAGRLLQSHFSPDYTFGHPVDIEWLSNEEGIFVLQLRPYSS